MCFPCIRDPDDSHRNMQLVKRLEGTILALLALLVVVFGVGMAACYKETDSVATYCKGLHPKTTTVSMSLTGNWHALWISFILVVICVVSPWLPCRILRRDACTTTGSPQFTYFGFIAVLYVICALEFSYIGCGLALWRRGPVNVLTYESAVVDPAVNWYAQECRDYSASPDVMWVPVKVCAPCNARDPHAFLLNFLLLCRSACFTCPLVHCVTVGTDGAVTVPLTCDNAMIHIWLHVVHPLPWFCAEERSVIVFGRFRRKVISHVLAPCWLQNADIATCTEESLEHCTTGFTACCSKLHMTAANQDAVRAELLKTSIGVAWRVLSFLYLLVTPVVFWPFFARCRDHSGSPAALPSPASAIGTSKRLEYIIAAPKSEVGPEKSEVGIENI